MVEARTAHVAQRVLVAIEMLSIGDSELGLDHLVRVRCVFGCEGEVEAECPESQLLGQAARALHAGRNDDVTALLDEHARRFPNGQLTRERELTRQRLDEASQRRNER